MFQVIEYGAVIAAAIYGILQARAFKMDALGVFVVAFTCAFGGGTLRDLLLDRQPLFWILNPHYPIIVFVMSIATCLIPRIPESIKKYLHVPDALGLGLFSIVGAQYALDAGTTNFIAALLGVITGTFGGVMSDLLCARVPSLFKSSPLYATCAFLGCWIFFGCGAIGLTESAAAVIGITSIVLIRFAALYWNVCLPELDSGAGGRRE